jgi:hypothetical protein
VLKGVDRAEVIEQHHLRGAAEVGLRSQGLCPPTIANIGFVVNRACRARMVQLLRALLQVLVTPVATADQRIPDSFGSQRYKRLRTSARRAWRWLRGVQSRAPELFAHCAFGSVA